MLDSPSSNLQGPPDPQADSLQPLLERPTSRRYLLFKGGILGAFGLLAARLWQMQIARREEYAQLAQRNRTEVQVIKAPRGVIYDRNGIVLAGNQPTWNITIVPANLPLEEAARRGIFAELDRLLRPPWVLYVNPRRLPAIGSDEIFQQLAGLLDQPASDLRAQVERSVKASQLAILADDLPSERAPTLQRELAGIPGPVLLSQHEFRVNQHVGDPRLAVTIQRSVARSLALTIESRSLLLPGAGIEAQAGRAYPSGTIAAHVIGYIGPVDEETRDREVTPTGKPAYDLDDTIGQSGMEAHLESILRGTKGIHLVEVDINRRIVRTLNRQSPIPGSSVALTIDLGLQKAATDALNEQIARAGVTAGAAVALDPSNGEILALVSLPSYNNQQFSDGLSTRAYQQLINDLNKPLFNRCLGGLYPPGACFLPFVALEALRQKVTDISTIHHCHGAIHVPAEFNEISRSIFRCWKPGGHGPLTVTGALAHSCDVFFYNMVVPPLTDARNRPYRYYDEPIGGTPIEFKGLGIERLNGAAATFGFGRKTNIELPGESVGLLPTPEWKRQQGGRGDWTMGDTINTGVGQGDLQVTPLQLATAVAALANRGTLYRPRLLKSLLLDTPTSTEGPQATARRIEEQSPIVAGRIEALDQQIELVRLGMQQAVISGTATQLALPGISVAAKTGTAETETADAQGRSTQKPHAWIVAFAPYEQPKIALAVIVEKAGEGARFALPVAERMLRTYLKVR